MALFNKKEREQKIDKQKKALEQFHHATIVSKTIIDQVEHLAINGVGKVNGNKVELRYSLERVNDQFGAKESDSSSVTVADKLSPKEQVGVLKVIYNKDKNDENDDNTVTFDSKDYKVINLEQKSGSLKGYYDAFKEHTDKISSTISDMLEGSFKTLFHSSHHQFAGDFNVSDNTIVNKTIIFLLRFNCHALIT